MAYDQEALHKVNVATKIFMKGNYEDCEEVELGFIDGLFTLYE